MPMMSEVHFSHWWKVCFIRQFCNFILFFDFILVHLSIIIDGLLTKNAHKYQMSGKALPELDKSALPTKKAPAGSKMMGTKLLIFLYIVYLDLSVILVENDTTDADENENKMNVETGPAYETPKGKRPTVSICLKILKLILFLFYFYYSKLHRLRKWQISHHNQILARFVFMHCLFVSF